MKMFKAPFSLFLPSSNRTVILSIAVMLLFFVTAPWIFAQRDRDVYENGGFRPISEMEKRGSEEREFKKAKEDADNDPNLFIVDLTGVETGTGYPEKYEYRLPDNYHHSTAHPLMVGWHGYGASFHSVYSASQVDEECNDRDWVFLGFKGYDQCHFGHPIAQKHCSVVIWHLINVKNINIDTKRIYMAGFSMGAHGAASYACRHMSPKYVANMSIGDFPSYPVAGLIFVSPVFDLTHIYTMSDPQGQDWIQKLFGFEVGGGNPLGNAIFRYALKQVSTLCIEGPTYDIDESMGQNLKYSIPVYMTWGANDQQVTYCPMHAGYFRDMMNVIGATHQEYEWTTDPEQNEHDWLLLDTLVDPAFDFIEIFSLDDQKTYSLDILADRDATFYWLEVDQMEPHGFTQISCAADSILNEFTIGTAENVARLRVDVEEVDLKDDQDMVIHYVYKLSGSDQILELKPILNAPLSVTWTFFNPKKPQYPFYSYSMVDELLSFSIFPPGHYDLYIDF